MKTTIIKIKTLTLTLAIVATTTSLFAVNKQQGEGDKKDKIEALRIAFISQELNLSPQEAEKFWPAYNAYRGELQNIRKNFPPQQMTAEQQLDFQQKMLDLKKKYTPQFEGALGTQKLNRLYNVERDFVKKLREIREQRMQQRGQQAPPARRPGGGGFR